MKVGQMSADDQEDLAERWRLFLLAIRGDREAWASLVLKLYASDLRRHIDRKHSNTADVDRSDVLSVVADTALKAWSQKEIEAKEKITSPEEQRKLIWANLRLIADRRLSDFHRKGGSHKPVFESDEGKQDHHASLGLPHRDEIDSPSEQLMSVERDEQDRKLTREALQELNEQDRWVMERYLEYGYKGEPDFIAEVAREFESSKEAAAKRLNRAKSKHNDAVQNRRQQAKSERLSYRASLLKPSKPHLDRLAAPDRWIIEKRWELKNMPERLIEAATWKFGGSRAEAAKLIQAAIKTYRDVLKEDESTLT